MTKFVCLRTQLLVETCIVGQYHPHCWGHQAGLPPSIQCVRDEHTHVWKAWNWLTSSLTARLHSANLSRCRCPVVCPLSTCREPRPAENCRSAADDLTTALRVGLPVAIRHPWPVQSTRRAAGSVPGQSGRTRSATDWKNDGSDVRTTLSHCVLIVWPHQRLIDWQWSACFWRLQLLCGRL